jgi:hypothetical protein
LIGRPAPFWCCCTALIGFAAHASDPIVSNQQGSLATVDTSISVEAGDHAAHLGMLSGHGASWHNRGSETLPAQVEVRGASQPLVWHLDHTASRFEPRSIEVVYVAESPRLKLSWRWRARSNHGPLEHTVSIQNLSSETVWLPLQPSLQWDWEIDAGTALQRFWVEKGADIPSAEGIHLDALRDGDSWEGTSSTYARPLPHQAREMIPYVLLEESGYPQRGWYTGIEFSGRTRIRLQRRGNSLRGEAGLNPLPGPYKTRVPAGGSFETPTVFIGAFEGGPDGAGNILRRWVREVLNNPSTLSDPSYPLLVNNSWGSGMAVNEDLAQRMIVESAQLGFEMFHLDAGWFRAVGDWQPDPKKFPHGIASVADFAHGHGLKFGLWVDWTQAGTSREPGALNVYDPGTRAWLIADPPPGWRHAEPFKGVTIDLGAAGAKAWAAHELERIVSDYHLDMLEHDGYLVAQGSSRIDHLAAPPEPATLRTVEDSGYVWVDGSNSTDVSYHATQAYYEIYQHLRARHPSLLLEVCNDGGRMVDFGSAAHGDYFSITDTYDPVSNRRAFYDASYVLPSAMLESYVAKFPATRIENFRYALRSGMLGWFSLMLDASQWTPEQRGTARQEFALYKSALRPLIREADLYHVGTRPDGVHWDGIEYYSAKQRHGVLYAFRGSAGRATHRFRLLGLDQGRSYRVRFQDHAATQVLSGEALMQGGVDVALPLPLSSELILLEEIS